MALANNPRESSVTIDLVNGANQRRLFNSFPERFEKGFEAEIDHFIDCIDGRSLFIMVFWLGWGGGVRMATGE